MTTAELIAAAGKIAGGAWSFVTSSWKWLAFAAAIGAICFVSGCVHGQKLARADQAEAAVAAQVITDKSAGAAAGERDEDRAEIGAAQEERDHAIENSGDDRRPDPATLALQCERVRRAGTISEFPACRGYAGGGQAASNR